MSTTHKSNRDGSYCTFRKSQAASKIRELYDFVNICDFVNSVEINTEVSTVRSIRTIKYSDLLILFTDCYS